jgi:hypothetical protein
MNYKLWTRYEECVLQIKVKTFKPVRVRIIVSDAKQKNTEFTNRYMTINGEKDFIVRMPLSPEIAILSIYNDALGANREDNSIEVVGVKKLPLEKRLDLEDKKGTDAPRDYIFFVGYPEYE